MENDMYTNAQLIRKLREDRAWSQEHLAAVAGLSARTIQRVEAENSASRETRMAIAAALGLDLAQLNRVDGSDASAARAAPVTVASQSQKTTLATRAAWGFVVVYLMFFIPALYTLGKEMALRDGRADCIAKKLTRCPMDQNFSPTGR